MGYKIAVVSLSALLGVVTSGCAAQAVTVPESPPPRVTEPSTLADPSTVQDDATRPLVAPPPAYGNKVVLARRGANQVAF